MKVSKIKIRSGPEPVSLVCSKGHAWRADRGAISFTIMLSDQPGLTTGSLCPFCLISDFKKRYGAEEVGEGKS
jgi:hypothetical protein